MLIAVGIDDTDWEGGGCTTHVMYRVLKEIIGKRGEDSVVGLPRLTRLNPYVPFKTRGNASLSVILDVDDVEDTVDLIWSLISQMRSPRKASPGLAYRLLDSGGEERLLWLYRKALRDVVPMDLAIRIAEKTGTKVMGGRGIIGALASLGYSGDSTFEFIAYGPGSRERLSVDHVVPWDESTKPFTFLNIWRRRIMISPHTGDPVLIGVRGDSPYHVLAFGNYLASLVGSRSWILYLSNQGTDAHRVMISEPRPYRSTGVVGVVEKIKVMEHGHFLVELGNGLKVLIYRHLGMRGLGNYVGCLVYVWGGVKPHVDGLVIHAEGLRVLHDRVVELQNPRCPICSGSMESLGRSRGFRCRRCGFRGDLQRIPRPRAMWGSLRPRESEYRHLMKPKSRLGMEGMGNSLPRPLLWIM
jgi:tRNA(Ile2)-agmatinylcytidine synthase